MPDWRWLTVAMLAAITGCRSTPDVPAPSPSAAPNADANWFCEMGKREDEWECVQDGALDGAPAQRTARAATASAKAPERTEAAARTASAVAAPARPAPPSQSATPPAAELPLYRRLAYRPSETVPLDDLPPGFFAVQLVAVQTKAALEQYAERERLRNMSAARVERDGELFYVLLLGVYETRARAERAAANLPAEFQQFSPWVRSVASLQEAIARANALAGTDQL